MTFYYRFPRRYMHMRRMMDRLMDELENEQSTVEREMTLALDVLADDDGYTVRALIPGVQAEDLEVEVLNNTVTISGEFPTVASEGKYLLSELPTGRFSRSITLPTALDSNKVEATLQNGVLTLRIPKAEAHRPKAIQVKSA